MTEPAPEAPNWADIAEQARQAGFGVPDEHASEPVNGAQDEPPKRRGRSRRTATKAPPVTPLKAARDKPPKSPLPPYREGMFVAPLEEIYGYAAMGIMVFDQVCAQAIMMCAHDCAVSLDKMAKTNHGVRRILVTLTQTSAMGAVITAHAPILAMVLLHHVPAAQRIMGDMGQKLIQGMMIAMQERQRAEAEAEAEAERARQAAAA